MSEGILTRHVHSDFRDTGPRFDPIPASKSNLEVYGCLCCKVSGLCATWWPCWSLKMIWAIHQPSSVSC